MSKKTISSLVLCFIFLFFVSPIYSARNTKKSGDVKVCSARKSAKSGHVKSVRKSSKSGHVKSVRKSSKSVNVKVKNEVNCGITAIIYERNSRRASFSVSPRSSSSSTVSAQRNTLSIAVSINNIEVTKLQFTISDSKAQNITIKVKCDRRGISLVVD